MRNIDVTVRNIGVSIVALACCACGTVTSKGSAAAIGEDDFTCAALIYAANDLVEHGRFAADKDLISSNSMTGISAYATLHAEAEGLDGMDAFNLVKFKAMRLSGKVPSSERVADDKIIERAKACIGQLG